MFNFCGSLPRFQAINSLLFFSLSLSFFKHNTIRKVTFCWRVSYSRSCWERANDQQCIHFLVQLSFSVPDRTNAQLAWLMVHLAQCVILFPISISVLAFSLKWQAAPVEGPCVCRWHLPNGPQGNDGWNRLLTRGWGLWPLGDIQQDYFHFHCRDKVHIATHNTHIHS